MTNSPEKLSCISIIVCDDVFRDETTKKLVVIGTFNRIWAKEIPCTHRRINVLFSVTNARGRYDLKVSVEHEKTGRKVIELGGPFEVKSPLDIYDINLVLENLVFCDEGKYWVEIKADGEIIQQRPFFVQKVVEPNAGGASNGS